MLARTRYVWIGLLLVLAWLVPSRGAADSSLRLQAGATVAKTEDSLGTPGLVLGGALGLTRWSPVSSITLVPQLDVLFARRHAWFAADGTEAGSYVLDLIELPLSLRTELVLGGRLFYVLAGVHGGVLLQAQRTNAMGIVDRAEPARRMDGGFLVAGGFKLASSAWGELFLEARYQRGYRALVRGQDHDRGYDALSLLLGYELGAEPGDSVSWAPERRLALKGGPVATRLSLPAPGSYGPGAWFGGAWSPARLGSRLALVPQLELAFVHRRARDGRAADTSLALDSLELALIMRGELMVGERAVYGLGGVYGSALLRAQSSRDGVITDIRDAVSAVDAGWLAGVGVELGSSRGARLSVELRYQRGVHDQFSAGGDEVTQQSLACLVGIVVGSARPPRAGPVRPVDARSTGQAVEALGALEATLIRQLTALKKSSTAARPRRDPSQCHGHAARSAAGVLAMPLECTGAWDAQATQDAFRTVLLALARDMLPLLARLKLLAGAEQYGEYPWDPISRSLLAPTITYVQRMVDALHAAQTLVDSIEVEQAKDVAWEQAGRHYEEALLTAQVLAVWVSWLDFGKSLAVGTDLNAEWILERLARVWNEMERVLEQLGSGEAGRRRAAARGLQSRLAAWSEELYAWGKESEQKLREGEELMRKLLLAQAAFDLATTRQMLGPTLGRAAGLVFVLPGIGGVTAGGAATGVRVVISAEWLRAMQHLIAIGAITTVEIAQIAGMPTLAVPAPGPASAPTPAPAGASTAAGPQGSVRVVMQHRGGNRQVEINGRRWHLPKGKSPDDIPASDPVGDRLQAKVSEIARGWSPSKLSRQEQKAIDNARAAGATWRAKLLERQARGRWVENEAKNTLDTELPQLKWSNRGVDAVDRRTGIKYEVLSGTDDNLNHHAKRMAGELFRMIYF